MGEFDLISEIRDRIGRPSARVVIGPGDDSAVTRPDGAAATTVDAIVEGVHFRRDRASLTDIGYKALAAAGSDLAAMGARPGEAYAVLGVPPDLDEDGATEVLAGLIECADAFGLTVAGGDIVRAGELFISVTAVGYATSPERFVTRSGARPGDAVVLTGEIGAAAAGLALMDGRTAGAVPSLDRETAAALRLRQLRPPIRIEAGIALAGSGAGAMIDLSDGLGADAGHIVAESGVAMVIDLGRAPLAPGLAEVAEECGLDLEDMAASGGEDYELLATIAPEMVAEATAAVAAAGTRLTEIGTVQVGTGLELRSSSGAAITPRGFDQLARPN